MSRARTRWVGWVALGLGACRGGDETGDAGAPPDPDTLVDPQACSAPAPETWETLALDWPGEEFAFDASGHLVTAVDWASAVWAMDRSGAWTLVAPFDSGEVAGVDFDLDGSLLVDDEANGRVARLTTSGTTTVLAGGLNSPNSIAVHRDGYAVVSAFDRLLRMDTTTGETVELASFPGQDLDGVVFSPSGDVVWFNLDESGEVYRLPLGAGGVPMREPELVETINTSFGEDELDGMAMDACGNLYMTRTDGRIGRIRADGVVEPKFANVRGEYVSALHFGSGIGGWERDHLYVMDRYGELHDLAIGIPGAQEPHLPAN